MINRKNQISLLRKFIKSNEKTILINQVNENITDLYSYFIKFFANHQGIKININSNIETKVIEDDLFGIKQIQTFYITSQTKLKNVLDMKDKKVVFTDYKNYKKADSKITKINSYQYEEDISLFIKEELNIDNDELIFFCKNNPVLLFSETSKYIINSNQYSNDRSLTEEKNHILDIRKKIYEIKRNNSEIKRLYQNIKKEVEYKKLNFLTF